ncbi:CASP8-associated protein 2 [Salminus brasiliensis]|uniref:CASP8-associated protein 2 n=1 Tax=Salminus brasiliensis TaxID=930266 RepID=UPI003B8382F2
MEESAMDELYGDLDRGHYGSVLTHDEDSVDIYSGLDDSPKGVGGNGEDKTFLSPQRLKDSMDLYEELITKEQEEKDTTYNELKSKFDAAQNQVQELLAKLQQMQTQNSCLHKENTLLKKNICALIKTARLEIVRKDEEISKLANRPGQGRFYPSRMERGQEHCLRNQTRNCKGSWGVAESMDGSRLSSQPARLITQTDATPSSFTAHQQHTRNDHDGQRKDSDGKLQSQQRGLSDKASNGKEKENACSESEAVKSQSNNTAGQRVYETVGQQMDNREGGKESLAKQANKQNMECNSKEKDITEKTQCDVNKSERAERDSTKMKSSSSKSPHQQNEDPAVLRKSGRSKSPFSQPQHVSPSCFHSQTPRGPPKVTADTQSQSHKQELRRNQGEDRRSRSGAHSGSEMSCSEKPATSLDRKMERRESREHHRKEERRPENVSSSERRHTRSDSSKEYEQKKTRDNEEKNRQQGNGSSRGERRSTRSESSKEHERRNGKESDGGVAREATDKYEKRAKDGKDGSHSDARHARQGASATKRGDHDPDRTRRKDLDEDANKRKTSSRTEELLSRSKASSIRDDSRRGKSSHVSHASSEKRIVKEKCADTDRLQERRRAEKEKQTTALERKSSNAVLAVDATKSTSPEKSRIQNGDGVQAHCLANVNMQSPLKATSSCEVSGMEEESSPKRKLTFMETLNLTLSPVKKQNQPAEINKLSDQPCKDALADGSGEERGSFELGEEFCVIDETENSQESVEAMDDDSTPARGGAVQLEPSNIDIQSSQDQDGTTDLKAPKTCLQDMKQVGGGSEEIVEGSTSPLVKSCKEAVAQNVNKDFIAVAEDSDVSATGVSGKPTESSQSVPHEPVAAERSAPVSSQSPPVVEDVCKEQNSQTSTRKHEQRCRVNSSDKGQIENHPEPQALPAIQCHVSQEEVSTSSKVHAASDTCSNTEASLSLEVVSSTVSVDVNLPSKQGCADLHSAISDVEITKDLEKLDSRTRPSEETHTGPVDTSSTIRDTLPEQASSSEPDSTEDGLQTSKPSSVVVPQDEDSMMLTLSSIKVIPDVISPLTSPVRQMKKVQPHCLGKDPHVKSLSRDFSTSAIGTNKEAIKKDMNKENKRPDSSVIPSVVKDQEVLSSTATEEELEEGEIISKSDDESSLIMQSPPANSASGNQPSATPTRVENRRRPAVTPTREKDRNATDSSKDSPTLNKRRFKTIAVPPKANISTSAEFMNMFLFIRSELRRKYMKLHKNVTKSAFCCIVDMSLASFTEFVDSVNFQKFCSQGNEIKPRLNKIISSVMSKVSSNGIVNRIFEQRADDLKQKLWNFVDGQFDFLFKELKAALKVVSGLPMSMSSAGSKHSNPGLREDLIVDVCKVQAKKPLSTAEHRPNKRDRAEGQRTTPVLILPSCVRGLGSRGKNIKATMEEEAEPAEIQPSNQPPAISCSEKSLQESVPAPENKMSTYARRLSHTGNTQDKTDFEILTEQQASSLTFNLVTDSQMGDIFRCLLQGSDLLEASVSAGDNQSWPLNTPRKEGPAGESVIGVVTPSKIITPSKLITAWTSISPYKLASPNNKIQMPLNPAIFDESCLLEVPSNALPNQAAPGLSSQQSFSILAEDLAVSLTIPSPLKSDGHLSFLHPASGQPLSAPSSVISAHYSEDALIDGEDATEQDIHLSLDTDNSSCESSTCGTWVGTDPAVFQFKPNLPMQAEVMERSNDHFIVRIRHTSTGAHDESRQELEEAISAVETSAVCQEDKASVSHASLDNSPLLTCAQTEVTSNQRPETQMSSKGISSDCVLRQETTVSPAVQAEADSVDSSPSPDAADITVVSNKEKGAPETADTNERISRKRKKHHSGPKAKRSKTEKHQDKREASKQRHKKRSKSCKERGERTPSKKRNKSPQLSPSLSAKNVIRKKGEVVVTWTREEDRDILVHLKMKGASSKTFAALSNKLKKSPAQIEERFSQLMKLFKKKEKMES